MKVLRQHKREKHGIALHMVQFEIPASKRLLTFYENKIAYKFYLSVPRIGILARFFVCGLDIHSYSQYGFFIRDDNKTFPMVFPNISKCFKIDHCSLDGMYVQDYLKREMREGGEDYSRIIGEQFFQTGFLLETGSVTDAAIRFLANRRSRSNNYDLDDPDDLKSSTLLDFYDEWQKKTKTIEGYDFIQDNLDLLYDIKSKEKKRLTNEFFPSIYVTIKSGSNLVSEDEIESALPFLSEIATKENLFLNSQIDSWGSNNPL